jgi:5-methylcytosine-specific restriction enzyme A
MGKNDFIIWLQKNTTIKPYSIGRYSAAIDTISTELGNYGLSETNLYNVTDTAILDKILNNPEFKKKNNKGNRMYSAALNHFKSFVEEISDIELQTELLKEEVEFEKYLKKDQADVSRIKKEDKPQDKPNLRTVNNTNIWSRDPRMASDAVLDANYLCEFNNEHEYFISKYTTKNYVEAHHLIPIKYQDEFDCSLDIPANIVSICLVCHKKIHYGLFNDKKEILEILFNSRKERLKASGIDIDITLFYSYYQD